jgi:hypothetical protein
MRILLPIILVSGLLLAGCGAQPQAEAKQVEEATLAAGTPVQAILLQEISAGATDEGEEVALMVSEDVKDAKGRVVVPKGSPVVAEVTLSRSEGTLSALMNQPARLNVRFKTLRAADGTTVELSADLEDREAEFEFTRANTGRGEPSRKLESLLEDEANEEAMAALQQLFESGDVRSLDSADTRDRLQRIADEIGLEGTSRVIRQNELSQVGDLLQAVRRGSNLATLASGGSLAVVDAALELASVAGHVGGRLSRMVKGRTIRAHVGTPVTAYVVEEVVVKIRQD